MSIADDAVAEHPDLTGKELGRDIRVGEWVAVGLALFRCLMPNDIVDQLFNVLWLANAMLS